MISISRFVHNFKKGFNSSYLEEVFLKDKSYHFSLILSSMFNGEVIYDKNSDRFLCKVNSSYYDINGESKKDVDEVIWEEISFRSLSISKFIENFKEGFDSEYLEDVFLNGNCYHFSLILKSMFNGEIIYDPHIQHFLTKIDGAYYDISGEVEAPMDEYAWDEMDEIDYEEYLLIEQDCVYKI